jgi:hypothetical protein
MLKTTTPVTVITPKRASNLTAMEFAMAENYLPPVEFLRECFSYDPATGEIRWKARPRTHFVFEYNFVQWNAENVGNLAFQSREAEGYGRSEVRFEGKRYRTRASRLAFKLMTGQEPEQVDHINGDATDDRWENLRAATNLDNARNKPGHRNKTLPKGVQMERKKFVAALRVGDVKRRLGHFDTPAEAHAAYCEAASAVHGEFFNPGPARPSVFD